MAQHKEQDASYFDNFIGAGTQDIGNDAVSTSYLSMIQPGSAAASDANIGKWRNSATGEVYGQNVKVIVMAFKTVWTERSSEPPFTTVARYEPNSIKVDIKKPKPGQKGFPEMTNHETGNKVQELFIYACVLPEHPEAGVVYFSPTAGSMKTCKRWNALLRSQRLPNGKLAPIFGYEWELGLNMVANPKQPSGKIAQFSTIMRGNITSKALFEETVQPQLGTANNPIMLAAPEASGDVDA